ncbi:MAG: di-trans,poly-cis-decaprenylcistransferase [Chloroflexi bacterium]|nr:di-trans,poly-cis-decaprenylcistransferase [Chloroflexota bacterium]
MDGNGRWAGQRGLPRLEGHRAGTQNLHRVLEALGRHGVRHVTLYAFSTENWSRPPEEVRGLLSILQGVIESEVRALHAKNVRILHLGRLDRFPKRLQREIRRALELTRNNTGMTLGVAFDYGGRDEILEAVKAIVRDGLAPERIDETVFGRYLYTRELPDPDLIIRTAGEQRLSNFLIWQSAYSEFYCSPCPWPDFDEVEVERALRSFGERTRRFGALIPIG